jgi:hypothetical protein
MPGTEDNEWAWWWLRRGYVTVVDPALRVEHDHGKDPLSEIFVRSRREWAGFAMFRDPIDFTVSALVREWWAERGSHRSHLRARASHRRAARLAGKYAGSRHRPTPVPAGSAGRGRRVAG